MILSTNKFKGKEKREGGASRETLKRCQLNATCGSCWIFKKIYLFIFIFGCVGSLLLRTGSFPVVVSRGYSSLCCAGLSLGGLSCCRARALGAWASAAVALGLSSCGSMALEHRLSSCGSWTQLLRGMWDPPGPGLEPVSPALAGGFLTTAPPGKPLVGF